MSDISRISMSSLEFMMFKYINKFGKPSMGHRMGKSQFAFQFQRRTMPKYVQTTTIALTSHASKVMLKILPARLQQYVN